MTANKSSLARLTAAKSRLDVASILDIDIKSLTYLLYKKPNEKKYSSFEIKKKNGGTRIIHAPDAPLKSLQKKLAAVLQACLVEIEEKTGKRNAASHGFRPGKGILSNASVHRNRRYVLNLDLKDFFPTITFPRIRGFFIKDRNFNLHEDVATILAQIACFESKLPQGSPCSPIISNMIAGILDFHLSRLAFAHGCTYTRYADDLTFSTNKKNFPPAIAGLVPESAHDWKLGKPLKGLIKKSGFEVNDSKTRMQYKASRQVVTGIVVNKKVNVPAEYRRLVRAYVHSLVSTGSYNLSGHSIKAAAESPEVVLGTVSQLHGMLGFIHSVDGVYRAEIEVNSYNYPGIKIDSKNPTGSLAIYRKFLFYTRFYANELPLIICEGKTDNVYISNAIHQGKSRYPGFLKKDASNKDVLAFRFFKYARKHRKKKDIHLPNYSTARILGNGSGGGPNLAALISNYRKESQKFKTAPQGKPVIFIVDNDSGGQPVFSAIKNICGYKVNGSEEFIHVFDNIYVIPIPLNGRPKSSIEDLFSEKDKSKTVDGKPFDFSKDADKSTAGKASFAYDYVAKQPSQIDWSGFDPLLESLAKVQAHCEKHLAQI